MRKEKTGRGDEGYMRVVMFMASQCGFECYNAVKKIKDIEIAGILTPPSHFVLRYDKDKTKQMSNTIYREAVTEGDRKSVV